MEKVNETVRKKDNIIRKKEIFILSIDEFKKGDWLKNLKINKDVEIRYREGYLAINTIQKN